MSPPPSDNSFDGEQSFHDQISSLAMPRNGEDSDSDSEVEDQLLGLVMDRSAASSTVSLDMEQRLDALQRLNTDLGRKLLEAERTLQNRLAEHEQELEDMQIRLEEARSELSATKREEKELRSKEVRVFVMCDERAAGVVGTELAPRVAPKHDPNCCARVRNREAPKEPRQCALVVSKLAETVSRAMRYACHHNAFGKYD